MEKVKIMDPCESVTLLQSYFDFFYAKEIKDKRPLVFKAKRIGCQNARLSQRDHNRLTLTEVQQLNLYFEDVLLYVDENDILQRWEDAVCILDMSSELIYMFKLKLFCKDWRETNMKYIANLQWRNKMITMALQLLTFS